MIILDILHWIVFAIGCIAIIILAIILFLDWNEKNEHNLLTESDWFYSRKR